MPTSPYTAYDPPRRPSLLDALQARRDAPQGAGISVRGVGNDFSATVDDDDPYANRVAGSAPGDSRGDTAGAFLGARIGEISRGYEDSDAEMLRRTQRLKNVAALEAARGQADVALDPSVQQQQRQSQEHELAKIRATAEGKAIPEQIRGQYNVESARTTASGRAEGQERSGRLQALARNLDSLYKLRYGPGGPRDTVTKPGTGMRGWFGMGEPESQEANPMATTLDSRIQALQRRLDTGDTGDVPEDEGMDLEPILELLRQRGYAPQQ